MDGGPPDMMTPSQQTSGTTYNCQLVSWSGLPLGNHTAVITVLNTEPFYVDYFLVISAPQSEGITGSSTASITPSATHIPLGRSQGAKEPPAIVIGSVVGGLAVLTLILLCILERRRRRSRGLDRTGGKSVFPQWMRHHRGDPPRTTHPFVMPSGVETESLPPAYLANVRQ
ncbi:hypothetical protein DFH07DRAFT_221842 [Mycena maculata]|uniref:Uncharacterized protein n=1 Tax=Mycena maculata TaxID=230809 RepID=A0AAD7HW89_9AGAR|nr:hypothetical protein DFH07DRAFT_221842 [Mycena maculata]